MSKIPNSEKQHKSAVMIRGLLKYGLENYHSGTFTVKIIVTQSQFCNNPPQPSSIRTDCTVNRHKLICRFKKTAGILEQDNIQNVLLTGIMGLFRNFTYF
jgi:hypothetical protein